MAVDERDEQIKMMQRRNAELDRLQLDIETITKQLEDAVNTKCEALAKADEVASMKVTLEYREKRLEQERSLMNDQIQSLTGNEVFNLINIILIILLIVSNLTNSRIFY